jgi:U3 small nucleolar ribonucleoprotein protein IMP4
VVTSRDPSSRLRAYASEVRLLFPGAVRMNRGSTTMAEVVAAAVKADFTDVIALQETRGEPDALIVSHLPFGPTVSFTLSNAVLRHDIEGRAPVSEAAPHLIFNNFQSTLGRRVQSVLQHLFPPPKPESTRVQTFSNEGDFISFRHHVFTNKRSGGGGGAGEAAAAATKGATAAVTLTEVGPRFEMRPFLIKLGTLDQDAAEVEWQLRSFTNTARKRDVL